MTKSKHNSRFLFRVWSLDRKKWESLVNLNLDFLPMYGQNDLIVQQCTGLKDRNGVNIYEGDIVKEHHFEDWGDRSGFDYIGVVRNKTYSTSDAGTQFSGFVTYPNLNENEDYAGNSIRTDCEVVGNVFENLNLLK